MKHAAQSAVETVITRGGNISIFGDLVRVEPRDVLDDELRAKIRANRQDIIALLAKPEVEQAAIEVETVIHRPETVKPGSQEVKLQPELRSFRERCRALEDDPAIVKYYYDDGVIHGVCHQMADAQVDVKSDVGDGQGIVDEARGIFKADIGRVPAPPVRLAPDEVEADQQLVESLWVHVPTCNFFVTSEAHKGWGWIVGGKRHFRLTPEILENLQGRVVSSITRPEVKARVIEIMAWANDHLGDA
ncbi:MAG: hypothetical protein HQK60_01795 [Deltaproteobacteria bacterium]|nr:hypothetical protein [Deltaproteobacteria bacterium]